MLPKNNTALWQSRIRYVHLRLQMSAPKFALARAYSESRLECAYCESIFMQKCTNHDNQIWRIWSCMNNQESAFFYGL